MTNLTKIINAPIEEVEVKSGSHHVEERLDWIPDSDIGFAKFLEGGPPEQNYTSYPYIYLKYVKNINGEEYRFISKPMQVSKEIFYLKFTPQGKSLVTIYVNPDDFTEYEFETFKF